MRKYSLGQNWLVAIALLATAAACSGGAAAGEACEEHSDCQSDLQCSNQSCVSQCEGHRDCGDGFLCDQGKCEEVVSQIGDECNSEWQCGAGQTCSLDTSLHSTCQAQGSGKNVGSSCDADFECQSSICTLGQCTQICSDNEDCFGDSVCSEIPRDSNSEIKSFHGCLPRRASIHQKFVLGAPQQQIKIPVPSNAKSFTITTRVPDQIHKTGVTSLSSPSGQALYVEPVIAQPEDDNILRYFRKRGLSTMLVPNSDLVQLETGFYTAQIATTLPNGLPGQVSPEVDIVYKLGDGKVLDLHFYFLNLDQHPCSSAAGTENLDAQSAMTSPEFQAQYLSELRKIIDESGLDLGQITYTDIDRADLDGIEEGEAGDLLRLSTQKSGISLFFVRSMAPDGIQALVGGVPGPAGIPGTSASGVAISMDTLCYRDWNTLARVSAQSIAGQMGLFNNRDPQGGEDPISDSGADSDNLMYFGEFGGTKLSAGQKKVLGRYPSLR